jgi:hypothetical protein
MAITNPFGRFFNDPDLEQIEGFINGILTTPVENSKTNSEAISSEFINNFYKNEEEKPELDQLFSKFSIPVERLQRYGAYDEIYRSVQMIKRIVKVYKPYIIQKNPVTGLWYLLRKTDYVKTQKIEDEQKSRDAKQFIDDAIDNFQLLKKLKNNIIHSQLMYGDCFVEVIDLEQEKLKIKDLSKVTIINEVTVSRIKKEAESLTSSTSQLQIDLLIEAITDQYVKVDPKIDEDELQVNDSKFQNTIIRVHKPHNIIILETSYGTVLGYLEVNKENATQPANSVAQSLSSITSRLVNTSNKDNNVSDGNVIINKIISHILKKVNASRGNKDSKTKYDASVVNDLKRFVIEQNNQSNQASLRPIEVRFIPVNRMVNFNLASTENHPYGGSLLESLMLPGKLYILSQLSNVMQKLSRAPVTRKWVIDSGSMSPQGTNQLLQKLKRELHNNRVSVEDLSSFKSVSKMMSDSKDLFVLSKNGTRALDVEVSSLGDPSVKVQDLEDSRREIIALSGVPAPLIYSGFSQRWLQNNFLYSVKPLEIGQYRARLNN